MPKNAAYYRDYRARQKAGTNHPTPIAEEAPPRGQLRNPYHDGLPDWPMLTRRLSNKQAEAILERINKNR